MMPEFESSADTAGAVIMVGPVTAQIGIAYRRAITRCVDKFSVAGIDTDVRNSAGVCIGKENKVTCMEIISGNGVTQAVLVSCCTGTGIAGLI